MYFTIDLPVTEAPPPWVNRRFTDLWFERLHARSTAKLAKEAAVQKELAAERRAVRGRETCRDIINDAQDAYDKAIPLAAKREVKGGVIQSIAEEWMRDMRVDLRTTIQACADGNVAKAKAARDHAESIGDHWLIEDAAPDPASLERLQRKQ